MESKLVYFDYDTSLYQAATAMQEMYIDVTHNKSGRVKEFKNITTFYGTKKSRDGGWLGDTNTSKGTNFKFEDFTIEHKVRPLKGVWSNRRFKNDDGDWVNKSEFVDPFEHAKRIMISSAEAVNKKKWCKTLKLIIGDGENYRYNVSYYKKYKEKRPDKPIFFKKCRKWLTDESGYDIVLATDCEADDFISIIAAVGFKQALTNKDRDESEIVIAGIDKDLLQCPGWWYHTKKAEKEPVWIDSFKAEKNLCIQMLMGDTVDNIPGLPGVTADVKKAVGSKGNLCGEVTAKLLLSGCKDKKDLWTVVVNCYTRWYDENPFDSDMSFRRDEFDVKKSFSPMEMMNEQIQLVGLMKKMNTPLTIEDKLWEVGYEN